MISKVAEFRVFIISGRICVIANKIPADPTQTVWNVHGGGRFEVVRWGDWNLEVCKVATKAIAMFPDLEFGAVDVMLDGEGKAWVSEINTAPAVEYLEDGDVSYFQNCLAKGFYWMLKEGREYLEVSHTSGWRGYLHPSIREYRSIPISPSGP